MWSVDGLVVLLSCRGAVWVAVKQAWWSLMELLTLGLSGVRQVPVRAASPMGLSVAISMTGV